MFHIKFRGSPRENCRKLTRLLYYRVFFSLRKPAARCFLTPSPSSRQNGASIMAVSTKTHRSIVDYTLLDNFRGVSYNILKD